MKQTYQHTVNMVSLEDFRLFIPNYEKDFVERSWVRSTCSTPRNHPALSAQTGPKSLLPDGVCLGNLSEAEVEFLGARLFPADDEGTVERGNRTENTGRQLPSLYVGKYLFFFSLILNFFV